MRSLAYEMDLPFGRDRVWDAWTTVEGLESWLCARARVDPVVGGLIELWGDPEGRDRGAEPSLVLRVLSIDRPRLLGLACEGCAGLSAGRRVEESRIEVILTPALDGTRLVITHAGWGRTADAMWIRDRFGEMWWGALEGLRAAIRP